AGFTIGKFVYISGPGTNSVWCWLRAEVTAVSSAALTLIPRNKGTTGTTVHFITPPTVALEETVSIYLTSGTVRRATSTMMSSTSTPTWSAANEIGRNFTELTFIYYDAAGNAVGPTSLANRMAIARVDIRLTVQVASPLTNGTRPTYSLA